MVSGLRVSFLKSKIMGVNIDVDFLHATFSFLSCAITSLPFTYLDFSIGAFSLTTILFCFLYCPLDMEILGV